MWYHSSWFFYTVFASIIFFLILYDLEIFRSKRDKANKKLRLRRSIRQTIVWLALGSLFSLYVYFERGQETAMAYIAAFYMEWSLSIDNVFVFVILFRGFKIQEHRVERILLIGIVLAIIFRMLFIMLGVSMVQTMEWLFYIFAAFLIYTGVKIYLEQAKETDTYKQSRLTRWLYRFLHIQEHDSHFFVKRNSKWLPTTLFLLVLLIAFTDIAFALDSIPAVLAITQDELAIYTSNIFAVMGLRSLYFTLQGSAKRFIYLSKGIGVVLIFIGLKIVVSEYFEYHIPVILSLLVIILSLALSILFSILKTRRKPT